MCAWTSPKTWSVNDILTASDMNTYVRDNTTDLDDTKLDLAGGTMTGDLTMESATPVIELRDTGYADPDGEFQISSASNLLKFLARNSGDSGWDDILTLEQLPEGGDGVLTGDFKAGTYDMVGIGQSGAGPRIEVKDTTITINSNIIAATVTWDNAFGTTIHGFALGFYCTSATGGGDVRIDTTTTGTMSTTGATTYFHGDAQSGDIQLKVMFLGIGY